MKKYESLAKILSEQELLFIEEALSKFDPSYLTEDGPGRELDPDPEY